MGEVRGENAGNAESRPEGPPPADIPQDQASPRDQVGSFRVGLMLHETSVMYPMLTVTVMSDGSVIVSPWAKSNAGWQVGIVRKPAGGNAFGNLPPQWDHALHCAESRAPRLNYHQSGIVTAKDHSHGKHLSMRLPSLPDVDARQIFTFRQGNPCGLLPQHGYPKRRHQKPKRGDLFVVSHSGPPPAVLVTGVLYAEDSVPGWVQDLGPRDSTGLVRGRSIEHLASLQGHGQPLVLVIRPRIDWRPFRGLASTVLTGLCATRECPSDSLTIASSDGFPAVPMLRADDMPDFPEDPSQRSNSIHTLKRRRGAPPTPH